MYIKCRITKIKYLALIKKYINKYLWCSYILNIFLHGYMHINIHVCYTMLVRTFY